MDHFQQLRILEAMLFAAASPMSEKVIAARMPDDADIKALLKELQDMYANRGVNLRRVGKGWAFRSAADLAPFLRVEQKVARRISRAAVETLAIIAYHQPITRAEVEEIRGVALSRGTLDLLLEAGWIRPRGRRRTAGRPVTWGTSEAFLDHFGIEGLDALPGLEELKAAGLLERKPGFGPLSALQEQPTTEEGPTEEELAEEESDEPDALDAALSELEMLAPDPEPEPEDDAEDEAAANDTPSAEVVAMPRVARSHGAE